MKKKFLFLVFISVFFPVTALAVLTIDNPLAGSGVNDIRTLIIKIVNESGTVVASVGIIALLVSAVLFVTAGGSEERYGTAKKALIYAVIGMAVGLGAKGLSLVIQNVIGVK